MENIPSVEECTKLMDEYGMPDHIKAHSFKVRDISVFLANELNKKGERLNVKLIESSALLHDIAKIQCIRLGKDRHDKIGAAILRGLGYNRVADIVEQHIYLWKEYDHLTEEEIVLYADKRVMHDKIVTLSTRFNDVQERYSSKLAWINKAKAEGYKVEKIIFKNLDFSPDDLISLLEK